MDLSISDKHLRLVYCAPNKIKEYNHILRVDYE